MAVVDCEMGWAVFDFDGAHIFYFGSETHSTQADYKSGRGENQNSLHGNLALKVLRRGSFRNRRRMLLR